ncbi:hypothetical protein ACNKHV_14330 [Shigella flexneri]
MIGLMAKEGFKFTFFCPFNWMGPLWITLCSANLQLPRYYE